jgi:hypothetical protein
MAVEVKVTKIAEVKSVRVSKSPEKIRRPYSANISMGSSDPQYFTFDDYEFDYLVEAVKAIREDKR